MNHFRQQRILYCFDMLLVLLPFSGTAMEAKVERRTHKLRDAGWTGELIIDLVFIGSIRYKTDIRPNMETHLLVLGLGYNF